jgi:CubicO group peptidase (beta-lactamase class C family)
MPFCRVVFLLAAGTLSVQSNCSTSVTGTAVPGMAALDQMMQSALQQVQRARWRLAVSCQGRLVFARGYGCAGTASNTAVQPDSIFRMASVSKAWR